MPDGRTRTRPRPPDAEIGTVPEKDRTLLQIAVGPVKGIEPYQSAGLPSMGVPSRTMVPWGLHVGEQMVTWDFVYGDCPPAEIARRLMRKWLEGPS